MEQYTYKFCPDFGVPCRKPIVEIISGTGYEQECEDEGCIEIVLDPDSPDKCVQVLIFCEDCGSCPPIIKDICFCDNGRCGPCQVCGPLGICIDVCKTNEFCEDDKCVECNPQVPCPEGKVCVNGKCVCPQGTFFHAPLNKCVECIPGQFIDKCRVCDEQGRIIASPCPGDCDPIEGCVDCLKDSTCASNTDGRTCCSPDKKCVCCPGYIYDNTLKRCVIKPPCTVDSCGPCEKCDPIKGCVPVTCPTGFKCDPIVNDCVADPCPPTPCKDATECGDKCGCDKVCVECAKLSCEDCAKTPGCTCNPLTRLCEKVKDCNNPCTNKYDCAPGCGCDNATCKSCANYSCEECAKINGCACTNSLCGDDGTKEDCNDTFKVEKGPVCEDPKLIATLTKDISCNCDPISFDITPPVGENSSFSILPKKVTGSGLVNYSEAGNALTSDNEYKVQSSFKIQITGKYTSLVNGVPTLGNAFSTQTLTVASTDFRSASTLAGGFAVNLANYSALESVTVSITHDGTAFTENKCQHGKQVIYSDSNVNNFTYANGFISYKNSNKSSTKVESASKRDPLFVWYEDLNIIVKREFVSGTGTYISELKPTSYKTKKSYKVTNDCSCKKEALYTWDCEKEKYFEKADITFDVIQCGKLFRLLSVVSPCNPLHLKEIYKLYVNNTFIGDVINNGVIASPLEKLFPEGVKSVEVKVDNIDCKKDYPVEDIEVLNPDIKPDCNITNGATTFTISENVPNSTIKIVKATYGTTSAATNTVTKTGSNFIITTTDAIKVEITYSNDCKETVDLVPKKECCDNCTPSLSQSEVLFTTLGEKGTVQINNGSCNFSGIKYTSDNSLVTISNSGLVDYTTPNNNLDVKITVEYSPTCKKILTLKFVKTSLTLSINKPSGCDDPILSITSTSSTSEGLAFEVRSSCDSSFKWVGTYTAGVTNTPSQSFGPCNYYIYSIGNIILQNFTNVVYNKLNVNITALTITQVLDDCSTSAKFIVAPDSTDLTGFKALYTIDGGSSQEIPVIREAGKNVITLSRTALIDNDTCLIKTLAIQQLVKDVTCIINYSQLVPVNLKCLVNFDISQRCINGVKHLVAKSSTGIVIYDVTYTFNNGSTSTSQINTSTGVAGEYSIPYLNDEIKSVRVTPEAFGNNIMYCSKEYQFQPLSCTKKSRTVLGFLSGCLNGNTLNLSDIATNKITVKNVIDPNLIGIVSTNPASVLKYNIFASNPAAVSSPQIIGNLVNGDILFTIPTIPNWNPNVKINLSIAEDSEYLPYNAQFNVVNNATSLSDWSVYTIITNLNQYNLGTSGTVQLTTVSPSFYIQNLVQHNSASVCVTYKNGSNTISSECKSSVPPGQFGELFTVPLNTTTIEICRTFNGCTSCVTMTVDFIEPDPQVGVFEICNGTARLYMISNDYPTTIKYQSECYRLINYEDLEDQTLLDPLDIEDSSYEVACNQSMCQNLNNLIRYVSCGVGPGGPDVFFSKDNFYTTLENAPSSIYYNSICYQKAGEVQGLNGLSFELLNSEDTYSTCQKCGLKNVSVPPNSCGNWNEITETWTQGFCDQNTYPFANCQPSGLYYICL